MIRLVPYIAVGAALAAISPSFAAKDEVNKEVPKTAAEFPPGWFPLNMIPDDKFTWQKVRDDDKTEAKTRLYLPPGVKTIRGVFVCFEFHSSDPRQFGRLWDFAVVTLPWQMEYDIGMNDKRSGRFKLGHPVGNMGYVLKYLELAGAELKHPELATVPLVGWMGQNGGRLVPDLFGRAPDRVLAWSDCWPKAVEQTPAVFAKIPWAYAWEVSGDAKERAGKNADGVKDKPTPPANMSSRASTYGFNHGIYSKFGFFTAFLDRCIKVKSADIQAGGKFKPWVIEDGWAGDYNPQTEWAPIAPYKEAKGMVNPVWLPDEYAAWMWRAYHSAKPDLKIVSPVTEYHGGDRSNCGAGYTPASKAGDPLKVTAEVKGTYAKVEFYDGNKLLGGATAAPYELAGVKFDRGLHALIVVGTTAEGKQVSSHPAFLAVE